MTLRVDVTLRVDATHKPQFAFAAREGSELSRRWRQVQRSPRALLRHACRRCVGWRGNAVPPTAPELASRRDADDTVMVEVRSVRNRQTERSGSHELFQVTKGITLWRVKND